MSVKQATRAYRAKIAQNASERQIRPVVCMFCHQGITLGRVNSHGVFIGGRLWYVCDGCDNTAWLYNRKDDRSGNT